MGQSMRRAMIRLGLAEPEESEETGRGSAEEAFEPRGAAARRDLEEERIAPAEARRGPDRRSAEPSANGSSAVRPVPEQRQPPAARQRPAREPRRDPEYRAPVTPIKRGASTPREDPDSMRTITTVHPRSYNDAKSVGESFRQGTPVIMDLTDLAESEAKRLVDFAAGLVFALHGSIERVTTTVFLLTPSHVEVIDSSVAQDEDLDAVEA